jgi:hypothetical protein
MIRRWLDRLVAIESEMVCVDMRDGQGGYLLHGEDAHSIANAFISEHPDYVKTTFPARPFMGAL